MAPSLRRAAPRMPFARVKCTLAASLAVVASTALLGARDADAACNANNLVYSSADGGDVVLFPQAFVVYWGFGAFHADGSVPLLVESVLGNSLDPTFGLGGTRWMNVAGQYTGTDYMFGWTGVAPLDQFSLDGTYSDESSIPSIDGTPLPLTDTQIGAEADALIINGAISTSRDTNVVMMLPPGMAPPIAGACGAHFVSPAGNLVTWISYPDALYGCAGLTAQALAHELTESATDAMGSVRGAGGWRQQGSGCEIGDICQGNRFLVQVQPESNTAGLTSQISTQQFWSNDAAACVYARSTHAFVYGIGMDHKMWTQLVQSDTTSSLYGWYSIGSPNGNTTSFVDSPGATSWGAGRLDVFALDTAGRIDHAFSEDTGSCYQWETLPPLPSGFVASSPDAVSWGAGNVQVWVKGSWLTLKGKAPSTAIWSNTYEWGQGWLGWVNWANQQDGGWGLAAGVMPASKISVLSNMATNIQTTASPSTVQTVYLAFIDNSAHLQVAYTVYGQMISMANIVPTYGGVIAMSGDPEITSEQPGRLDVLIRDTSGKLYDCVSGDMQTFGGATSGNVTCWPIATPPGGFGVGVGGAGMGDGRLLVVGRGASGTGAYAQFWTGHGPSGWLGGPSNGQFLSGLDVAAY